MLNVFLNFLTCSAGDDIGGDDYDLDDQDGIDDLEQNDVSQPILKRVIGKAE